MASIPKIMLIGAGTFGKNYIRILQALQVEGKVNFVGVCVSSASRALEITAEYGVAGYADYELALQELKPDAVFIVTPPQSHVAIVRNCLSFAHVFTEKPLAFTNSEVQELEALALKHGRHLMTGYIFRFHAVTQLLVKILQEKQVTGKNLKHLEGVFVNPLATDTGRLVAYELIHWFDMSTFLFGQTEVTSVFSKALDSDRVIRVDIRYRDLVDTTLTLGWLGSKKERYFTILLKDGVKIQADYLTNTVTVIEKAGTRVHEAHATDALRDEIDCFLHVIAGTAENPVPSSAVRASTRLAQIVTTQLTNHSNHQVVASIKRPKVAVIGAGIFGCNTAIELADFADVTVFEKNGNIMQEASYINQYRHHRGYHYPRSSETVIDIQGAAPLFDARYHEAIIRDIPSFYGISAEGSHVSAQEFLEFCDTHNLPYEVAEPPSGYMNIDLMQLSVKVSEPIYHYPQVKRVTERLIKNKSAAVTVLCNTVVTDCSLQSDGAKKLTIQDQLGQEEELVFDYVVNATYAHINTFARWIGVPAHPVRIDVAEVLVVTLPVPLVAVTVMDGPFGGILPSGNPQECTVYHAQASIIDRYTPENGLVKPVSAPKSQGQYIYEECLKLFPVLASATLIESRVVHRGVLAFHEHDDARIADLVVHGFGCWSILSGKIQSSVKTAQRIAHEIKQGT